MLLVGSRAILHQIYLRHVSSPLLLVLGRRRPKTSFSLETISEGVNTNICPLEAYILMKIYKTFLLGLGVSYMTCVGVESLNADPALHVC